MLVGDDPASAIYVRRKREACEEVGIRSIHHEPDGSISQEDLLDLVGELNDSDEVDGILVQLPLPEQIDSDAVVARARPRQGRRRAHPDQRRTGWRAASRGWCPARRRG